LRGFTAGNAQANNQIKISWRLQAEMGQASKTRWQARLQSKGTEQHRALWLGRAQQYQQRETTQALTVWVLKERVERAGRPGDSGCVLARRVGGAGIHALQLCIAPLALRLTHVGVLHHHVCHGARGEVHWGSGAGRGGLGV